MGSGCSVNAEVTVNEESPTRHLRKSVKHTAKVGQGCEVASSFVMCGGHEEDQTFLESDYSPELFCLHYFDWFSGSFEPEYRAQDDLVCLTLHRFCDQILFNLCTFNNMFFTPIIQTSSCPEYFNYFSWSFEPEYRALNVVIYNVSFANTVQYVYRYL